MIWLKAELIDNSIEFATHRGIGVPTKKRLAKRPKVHTPQRLRYYSAGPASLLTAFRNASGWRTIKRRMSFSTTPF